MMRADSFMSVFTCCSTIPAVRTGKFEDVVRFPVVTHAVDEGVAAPAPDHTDLSALRFLLPGASARRDLLHEHEERVEAVLLHVGVHVPLLQTLTVLLERQLLAAHDDLPLLFDLALFIADLEQTLEPVGRCRAAHFFAFLALPFFLPLPPENAASRSATFAIHLSKSGLFSSCVISEPP